MRGELREEEGGRDVALSLSLSLSLSRMKMDRRTDGRTKFL